MKKANKIRHWTVLLVLIGVTGLIAACEGTRSTAPAQPEARNFENPQVTNVTANFTCDNAGGTNGLTIIFENTPTGAVDRYK